MLNNKQFECLSQDGHRCQPETEEEASHLFEKLVGIGRGKRGQCKEGGKMSNRLTGRGKKKLYLRILCKICIPWGSDLYLLNPASPFRQ